MVNSQSNNNVYKFYNNYQYLLTLFFRCSRAMLANRISYWLGVTGPSYTVDSACSSSLYALEHAFRAIRDGHCDSAIVGGSNLCLHPYVSLQFSRYILVLKNCKKNKLK